MGGWRFRRTIRLLPGVHLNVSKSGVSLSLGGPGASINFNKDGHQTTIGLPGSGVSYRGERTTWANEASGQASAGSWFTRYGWILWLAVAVVLFMAQSEKLATAFAIVGCVHLALFVVSALIRAVSGLFGKGSQ